MICICVCVRVFALVNCVALNFSMDMSDSGFVLFVLFSAHVRPLLLCDTHTNLSKVSELIPCKIAAAISFL